MTAQGKEKLYELLKKESTAMLVTIGGDRDIHARPMALVSAEPDDNLWFVTAMDSQKVDEIGKDSRTAVVLQSDGVYLSVSGKARVVRDRERIEALWNDAWKVYFPEGKEDPDLALIEMEPRRGEYWDTSGLGKVRYLIRTAQAAGQGERPELDEDQHRKVEL